MKDKFWTHETLNKVTQVLSGAIDPPLPAQNNQPFRPTWEVLSEFFMEHNIKTGTPDICVRKAYYNSGRAVADHYDFEEAPKHYERNDTVVVLNPFFGMNSNDSRYGKWLEMDADLAKKFLVLGLPK
jgi:hypothetical protein